MDQRPEDNLTTSPADLPEVPVVGYSPAEALTSDLPTQSKPPVEVQAQPAPQVPPTNQTQPAELSSEMPETTQTEPVASRSQFISWQASEYIEHEKSKNWYWGLGAVALVLVLVAIFLMKEYTFALLVVVMAVAVGLLAKRPAAQVSYKLDALGVAVGDKFFRYDSFRAFGVVREGAFANIVLLPVKRFSPGVNIYFPQEIGEQIVDTLGSVLPMQEVKPDLIDRISGRLNF